MQHFADGGGRACGARHFHSGGDPAGRRAADGARIFILPWLAAAIINMVIGVYWAGVPLSTELPVLVVVFGVPAGIAWYLARWLRARAGT